MSISTTQNAINQVNKDIAQLEKRMSDELKKEAQINRSIIVTQNSISRNSSLSTIKSKQQQIQRYTKQLADIVNRKADINKKITDKRNKLLSLNQRLQKQQAEEAKKEQRKQEQLSQSYEQRIAYLTEQIEHNSKVQAIRKEGVKMEENEKVTYDVFISHASEDKDGFVRELAETLISKYGIKVWYDELSIGWGDSLRIAIDKGLSNSQYGLVVISRSFIKKGWTNYELDALFQIEMTNRKTILPVWHDITKDEVQAFSPTLAGRKALTTAMFTVEEIAEELQKVLSIGKAR